MTAGLGYDRIDLESEKDMITKVILKFEDLEAEQQEKVLSWLSNCEEKKETPFKLFLHQGGVNNKMIEIAPQARGQLAKVRIQNSSEPVQHD